MPAEVFVRMLAFVALVSGAAAFADKPQAEPVVHGRPLSHRLAVIRQGSPHSPESEKAWAAIRSARSTAVVPRVLPWLKDKDVGIRSKGLIALWQRAPFPEEVVAAFIECARDPDQGVRMLAVNALGEVTPVTAGVVPALIAGLKDPSQLVRGRAALSLARLRPAAKEAIPALTLTLRDDQRLVREAAQHALTEVGER